MTGVKGVVVGTSRMLMQVMHVGPEGLPSDFDEQVRVGDIITRWKGRAVISPQVFSELLASHYPGRPRTQFVCFRGLDLHRTATQYAGTEGKHRKHQGHQALCAQGHAGDAGP